MQLAFDFFDDVMEIAVIPDKSKLPIEMTLSSFLANPDWIAYLDPEASDESKGMYYMRQPDGKNWRGGWIGRFRNEKQAKIDFHRNQIFQAIHWGHADIGEKILSQYPNLKKVQDTVNQYLSWIECDLKSEYIQINLPTGSRYFHFLDFPLYSRIPIRGFVRHHGLTDFDMTITEELFDQTEIASMALTRYMSNILSESHRPHLMIEEYNSLRDAGQEVQFTIPSSFYAGYPDTIKTFTGKTVYNIGVLVPRIEYKEDAELKYWYLYPSQIDAIRDLNGNWQPCSFDKYVNKHSI